MHETAYFLFNKKFLSSLENYLTNNTEPLTVVAFDKSMLDYLPKKYPVQCIYIDDYFSVDELESFTRKAILWLHNWSQKKISNQKSIAEYFKMDGTSLWWTSGYLYFYSDVINLISTYKKIDKIISQEQFNKIILPDVCHRKSLSTQLSISDDNYPYKILIQVCESRNIPVEKVQLNLAAKFDWIVQFIKNRISTFIFEKIFLRVIENFRKYIAQLMIPKNFAKQILNKNFQKIIILSPSRNWGQIFDLMHFSKINGDSKIGYLYQKFSQDKSKTLIGIDCNSLPAGEFKILQQKLHSDPYLQWCSLEYFLDFRTCLKSHQLTDQYKKKASALLRQKDFNELFIYNGVNFHSILKARIQFIFRILLPYGAVLIKYYENLIEKTQPELIIITYETGLHGRAAITAAWNYDVPVLAIQHGKIHPSHPQYIHLKTNTHQAPQFNFAPIADKTCVFGEYTQQVLTEDSAYPNENIVITGQITTDAIPLAEKLYNKKQFLQQHKLTSEKPIVCLMSQNFDTVSDYEKLFQITCEGLNSFPDINLIVKLHPRENLTEARSLIQKYYHQSEKVTILQAVDLYEVIFNSDIIITGNSTVGLEAMIFRKPLITIEGFKYSMGYAESGASIGVTSVMEMQQALQAVFFESSIKEQLIEKGQKYLEFHLFKIDGKTCDRIIEQGNELIRKFKSDK